MAEVTKDVINTKDGNNDRVIVAERYESDTNGSALGVSVAIDTTDYLNTLNSLVQDIHTELVNVKTEIQNLNSRIETENTSNRNNLSAEMLSNRETFEEWLNNLVILMANDAFENIPFIEAQGSTIEIDSDYYRDNDNDPKFYIGDIVQLYSNGSEILNYGRILALSEGGGSITLTINESIPQSTSGGTARVANIETVYKRSMEAVQNAAFDVAMEESDKEEAVRRKLRNPTNWRE